MERRLDSGSDSQNNTKKKFQLVRTLTSQGDFTEDEAKAAVQATGSDDPSTCVSWILLNRFNEELVMKYSMEFDYSMRYIEISDNIFRGYIEISDNIFRSKTPWREGATVYDGCQLLDSGEFVPLTIKMIVPYNDNHVRKLQRLVDLPPHPNIVRTIKIIENHDSHLDKLYIVMDPFMSTNLQSYWGHNKSHHFVYNRFETLASWTVQLIDALKHLHREGFILENLTPRKVFFSPDKGQIKLSLIAVDENPQENDFVVVGSYRNGYQAPEVLQSATISPKSSVFSLGVILSCLWSLGLHPFGKGVISQMYNIMMDQGYDLSGVLFAGLMKIEFLELIKWMLYPDPEQRPTIEQVAGHWLLGRKPSVSTEDQEVEEGTALPKATGDGVVDLLLAKLFHSSLKPYDEIFAAKKETSPEEDVDAYIKKLYSFSKSEMLTLYQEIHELGTEMQSKIAQSIIRADFSGTALSLFDIQRIGSIINLSEHVDVVNFSYCKLQPGSLRLLKDTLTRHVKIDKLEVTGNSELMVSDLCSGMNLCARIGCRFVYDIAHLSTKDRQKLKNHITEYQLRDESKLNDEVGQKDVSRARKHLMKEERFQQLYKKSFSTKAQLQRLSLDFNTERDTTTQDEYKRTTRNKPSVGEPIDAQRKEQSLRELTEKASLALAAALKTKEEAPLNIGTNSTAESRSDHELNPQANLESKIADARPEQESTGSIETAQALATWSEPVKNTGPRTPKIIMDEKMDNLLLCAICLDQFRQPKALRCGHTFCLPCLETLMRNGRVCCPSCRSIHHLPQNGAKGLPES